MCVFILALARELESDYRRAEVEENGQDECAKKLSRQQIALA